ncbi:MAG: GNAT family N-acetyltransferase [Chloroflexota bacterium]
MHTAELRPEDKDRWDSYVGRSTTATFFQLSEWQHILDSVWGCETHYLYAEEGGELAGVLPLFRVKSRLFGHYFSSLPGGLSADNELASRALVHSANELVRQKNAQYLVIRDSRAAWNLPQLVVTQDHFTFVASLSADTDEIWSRIRYKERGQIEKATAQGIELQISSEMTDEFYHVYCRAMHAKGTPPYSRELFTKLLQTFPSSFVLLTVRANEHIAAGGFIAPFNDTVHCTWAAIPPESYSLNASHLLLWGTMRYGCENGLRRVDLGRSLRGSGSFRFKSHWGAEAQPLYQHYYLNTIAEAPEVGAARQKNATARLLTKSWQHMPLWLTQRLGAHVRKRVPFG